MEAIKFPKGIKDIFHKYKFVLIVVVIGILLMAIPSQKAKTEESNDIVETKPSQTAERALEETLSKISGVGRVSVMLTATKGEEVLYQTDKNASSDNLREETVIITGSDRTQNGLIAQVNPPIYLGAIIVCDGADDPQVHLAVVDAVSKVTGLGASSISVLKMN